MNVRGAAVIALLALCFLTHLAWGDHNMSWAQMGSALMEIGSLGCRALINGSSVNSSDLSIDGVILWEFEFRVITSSVVGVLLGWLGLLMQTWFRNPWQVLGCWELPLEEL